MRRVAALLLVALFATACIQSEPVRTAPDETSETQRTEPPPQSPQRPEPSTDEGVDTPFQDPTRRGAPQRETPTTFEQTYTRAQLKQSSPLRIEDRTATPFDDPGVRPFNGEVTLAPDGRLVRLPDGTFIMGLTDEDPYDIQNAGRKRVTLSAYYIDRFEVTNADYRAFLDSRNAAQRDAYLPDSVAWAEAATRADWQTYFYGSTYDNHPVVAVSWHRAQDYCRWLGMRLPTEAEWEYAARSGRVGGIYPWLGFGAQDQYGRYLANYDPGRQGQAADGYAFTAPVGSFPPSRWGVHDMSGNVAEWVQDDYMPTYLEMSDLDPVRREPDVTTKVVRGGSWDSNEFRIGVGFRDYQDADTASPRIGFRCAADVSQIEGTQRQFR